MKPPTTEAMEAPFHAVGPQIEVASKTPGTVTISGAAGGQPGNVTVSAAQVAASVAAALLDADLKRIIAATESAANQWAVRFEPSIFSRIKDGSYAAAVAAARKANRCTTATAQVLCACSWGLYQIMGFNLYAQTLGVPVGEYLARPDYQDAQLLRFLTADALENTTWAQIVSNETARENFIIKYNGPGNPDAYWSMMQAAAKSLGIVI